MLIRDVLRLVCVVAACALPLFTTAGVAQAQGKRFALVIGNEDYPSQPGNLNNPHEDVARIADALETVGFVVTRRFDRTQGEIVDDVGALSEALVKAGPEAIGFFYYSGHGASAEVNGKRRNYIMPAKTTITSGQQLALRGVPLDQLLDGLSVANAKAVFFVSDACRNTLPWSDEKGGEESKAFNAIARRSGLYVAFAAADGQTTPDDGYFSDQLSRFIRQPGQTADRVFTLALREVAKRRPGEKLPFIADGLTSDICFAGCASAPPVVQSNQPVIRASPTPPTAAPTYLDARTTPSTTRAPLISSDPKLLPDFALFRECEGCPEMVILPDNTFAMGSTDGAADEKPVRQVSIRRFAISRFETTWDEWDACVAASACDASGPQGAGGDNGWGKGRRPAIEVDWNDTRAFAGFATSKTGSTYRLPSEAEWEYAARGGSASKYGWGPADPSCDQQAFSGANFDACTDDRTRPVGSFRANGYGLFDLHGNVWEWVEDCHQESYASGQPVDGTAFTKNPCEIPVFRGGSWSSEPSDLRSAHRNGYTSTLRNLNLGFRLSRTL